MLTSARFKADCVFKLYPCFSFDIFVFAGLGLEMAFEFDLSVESFCNKWTTFAFERQITGVPSELMRLAQSHSFHYLLYSSNVN